MRILYGVQGTGNGHLTRARLMARAFRERDIDVDFLFSGRQRNKYFVMQVFGDARYCKGLSFSTRNGRVCRWQTLRDLSPLQLLTDIVRTHPQRYDLVLSDFEPITAWAARLKHCKVIGLGHQYALRDGAPMPLRDRLARVVLKRFAPVDNALGLHWYRFAPDILPPIIDTDLQPWRSHTRYTLVYLPFLNIPAILNLFSSFPDRQFIIYSPAVKTPAIVAGITLLPPSLDGFKRQLLAADNIICNAGFELISESLHLGIPLLAHPLAGQIEQQANGLALEILELANVAWQLDVPALQRFFSTETSNIVPCQSRQRYCWPDVASAVADWCIDGAEGDLTQLSANLWMQAARGSDRSCPRAA